MHPKRTAITKDKAGIFTDCFTMISPAVPLQMIGVDCTIRVFTASWQGICGRSDSIYGALENYLGVSGRGEEIIVEPSFRASIIFIDWESQNLFFAWL
jgi:hypothetical protein